MNQDVYVEPNLLEGEKLSIVSFIKEQNIWVLQSALPNSKNIEEYKKINRESALKMYPELKELLELELERNTCFRKGRNSGKWYDFIT